MPRVLNAEIDEHCITDVRVTLGAKPVIEAFALIQGGNSCAELLCYMILHSVGEIGVSP